MTDPTTVSRPSKLRAAILGGLTLGVASAVPLVNFLNCACCSLVVAGGFLASYLYLKEAGPAAAADWGDVALVGLLAGLFGAVVTAVVSLPFAFLGMGAGMWGAMQESLQGADLPDPLRRLLTTAGAGTLAVGMILISFVLNLFVYGLFATLGALLGAAVFQRRTPGAPGTTPPMPPMPPTTTPPPPTV
ncbi:MAG TPA: hypothetical protein VMS86_08110 [Thermoanaerobaculia bacterium]|nr:hypothetical protein [Thermoanaerobaculia bacterium]